MSYWSRSFPGLAEHLSEVRRFTAAVLGDHPGAEDVVLAASELAANAILHTASGGPDGRFVVRLATFTNHWQLRVDDSGGANVPRLCDGDRTDSEAGRGLALVAALSTGWGVIGDEHSRAVWAEFSHSPAEVATEPPAEPPTEPPAAQSWNAIDGQIPIQDHSRAQQPERSRP